MEDRVKRDKAFLGAVLNGVGSLVSGIIGARQKRKQEKLRREQENRQQVTAINNNINAQLQNDDYIDDFDNRIEFKNGGKAKIKRGYTINGTDRITLAKRFACGGRKKR